MVSTPSAVAVTVGADDHPVAAFDAPQWTCASAAPETVAATLKRASPTMPVKYPVGAVWEESPGLRRWLDPDTGLLTAIRPGQVRISAAVNGATSSADVRISLQAAA